MANFFFPKRIGCSCSILQTHKDVVTEMALHLSVQSLFRCRAVCKLWRDVIDSPSFRKLHNNKEEKEDDDDETVYLRLTYNHFKTDSDVKVSMKIIDKLGKSLSLNLGFNEHFPCPRFMGTEDIAKFSRPVKGLICFNISVWPHARPLAICNPFLGQFKVLPFSRIPASCQTSIRYVGIGCDGEEFYKVVEVVFCLEHFHHHVRLYSSRTGSWRELGCDFFNEHITRLINHITLSCNDGRFAHWQAWTPSGGIILTFDMKNEVFRAATMCYKNTYSEKWEYTSQIVAKDDGCSFVLLRFPFPYERSNEVVRIYESSISICEEGKGILSWKHVVDLELPRRNIVPLPLPRRDCVILKFLDSSFEKIKLLFYDYRARRFIGCFDYLPLFSDLFDYKGTFISP